MNRLRSTYSSYVNMRSRCLYVNKVFLADMGIKPTLRHSIDRINNQNGTYSPHNCRWATPKEQIHNSLIVRYITFLGKRKCIKEWVKYLRINKVTLHHRLIRGWIIKKAFTTPARKYANF